ncbi:MAG: class I SAM-dependent methyltransferase [Verrucomicrobia bacterium]|nr:class I SAM-dependent methyltransferase [Verrucomicrobiota bacterium]
MMKLDELQHQQLSRTELYLYCAYYFDHYLPDELQAHRKYFSAAGRGFGEDAFHAMWFLLFEHFRPGTALEIGVYRGQTITLWKLLAEHFGFECDIACVSPFSSIGDSVSGYRTEINYHEDVITNHNRFNLPLPRICRSLSTSAEASTFISAGKWQIAYIDGNHDYEVALQDWETCAAALASKGIIILDDSSLQTDFRPPAFSTAGHPGPSRVAAEIDSALFSEILAVGHNRAFQKKS